jgi:hypothetical protein
MLYERAGVVGEEPVAAVLAEREDSGAGGAVAGGRRADGPGIWRVGTEWLFASTVSPSQAIRPP